MYCNNNPLSLKDPTGLFDIKQFALGALQVLGGAYEISASVGIGTAAGAGTVLSGATASPVSIPAITLAAAGIIDGVRNVTEGGVKMLTASVDQKYDGMIPEMAGAIGKFSGKSEEEISQMRQSAGRLETLGGVFMPGKTWTSGASLLMDIGLDQKTIESFSNNMKNNVTNNTNNNSNNKLKIETSNNIPNITNGGKNFDSNFNIVDNKKEKEKK